MKLGSTVWDLSYSSTLSTCGLWMDCSEADLGKYTINRCECLSPRLLSGELWVGMYAHLKELWGKQKQMTVSIYFPGGQELMHTILKQLWAKSHSVTGETQCAFLRYFLQCWKIMVKKWTSGDLQDDGLVPSIRKPNGQLLIIKGPLLTQMNRNSWTRGLTDVKFCWIKQCSSELCAHQRCHQGLVICHPYSVDKICRSI